MSGAAKPTVFVIDRDAAIRDSLRVLLECEGIAVRTYVTATAFLNDLGPQPDSCIVADLDLPGLKGLDLLDELNRRDIVMSAILTTNGEITDCLRSSVDRVGATLIQKPYEPWALISQLKRCLDRCSILGIDQRYRR